MRKEEKHEHHMDAQYQHVSLGYSDHHGFLSYHPDKRLDPISEKGIDPLNSELRISDCG
jgi:hypothetical protein